MGSALIRIAAVKAAHPNHRSTHPLRVRLSDAEALELARQVAANPGKFELRDVGTKADGSAKPTLTEASEQLVAHMKSPALEDHATHAEHVARLDTRSKLRAALWEYLDGLVIDGVEVVEER